MDPVTAKLFGGERLWRYDFSFPETDRKIIAIEYADSAAAIRHRNPPEVDAHQGAHAVALSYAILESGALGRIVTVDEVMSEQVDEYQREINESLGSWLITKTSSYGEGANPTKWKLKEEDK